MQQGTSACAPSRRARTTIVCAVAATAVGVFAPAPAEATSQRRDADQDGLTNRFERKVSRTNAHRKDTDRDRLSDRYEVRRSHTDPRRKDTDRDGLRDRFELRRSHTDPRRQDTDRDGMNDGAELRVHRNPLVADPSPQVGALLGAALPGLAHSGATLSPTHPAPDRPAPDTTIESGPSRTSDSDSATFTFSSSQSRSTFTCRIDRGAWTRCDSPVTYSGLANGSHTFRVAAANVFGLTDPTPASRRWTVGVPAPAPPPPPSLPDTVAPQTSISSGPSGSSASASAAFAFSSSEAGSSFRCRLDGSAWAACTSPKAYAGLADGSHTFEVAATDAAGNADAWPASRTWTVDVPAPPPAPDTVAPQTSISSGPSGSSASASAAFAFSSSEAGSSFRCRLDGSAWAACTSPKAYAGLADGSHTFEVAATDAAGNADASPASRTWTVGVSTAPEGERACLASAECYPKPTSSGTGATGVPSGTTPAAGCTTSPASGATLTGCLYTGSVRITTTGSGATIRASEFRDQVTHAGSGTLTIESSNFGPTSGCQRYDNSITGSNYTVRTSRFNSHVSEGPRVAGSNILIEDNFIGPMCSVSGDHADGIQGYGGGTNVVVRHNTIDLRTAADVTSAIFFADDSQSADVQGNLVAGGGFSIRLHDDFATDRGPWVLKGNRIVNGAWAFGPLNNVGTVFTALTCADNRLVDIDAGYNVTSVGAVARC